jgi:hypothetical protein
VVHRRREFGIPGWFPVAHLFKHLSLLSVLYIFTQNGIWANRHKVLRKGLEASWHTSGLYLAAYSLGAKIDSPPSRDVNSAQIH